MKTSSLIWLIEVMMKLIPKAYLNKLVQWGATGQFQAKSESIAYHLPLRADLHTYNVLRFHSGPTSYLTRRVVSGSQLTSFRILFGEPTLRKKMLCWRESNTDWRPCFGCVFVWTGNIHVLDGCSWRDGRIQLACDKFMWQVMWMNNVFTNYAKKQVFRNFEISPFWSEEGKV